MTFAADERDAPAAGPAATMRRTAASIAVILLAARFVGVLRVFAQASILGPALADTYLTANKIPNIIFDVVAGGALSSVVVPVLARPMAANDVAGTRRNTSALLTWAVLLLLPLSLVGMVLSRPIMGLLLSGVGDAQLRQQKIDVGARMLVVFMPQLVLYGVGVVLTGALQAHRRFLAPALAPLLSSLVVIAAYLVYAVHAGGNRSIADVSRGEELILSLGTTLGVAALTLPLLIPTSRLGLRLRPMLRMTEGAGQQIRRLAAAGAVGLGAQQLATAVVIVLANRVVGGVIVYELAWTVFMVPWAVLAVPIATSVFPDLTQSAAAGDEDAFAASSAVALRAVVLTMLLATAVLVATAQPA
ncbi:MAG: putative peptidoglycan lipid flippase, partial [Frankiaceae bacterium]|nr:putative peptidoglycan lipid flippase [Frankiaceae bacterium]